MRRDNRVERVDRLIKIKRRGISIEMSEKYSGGDFCTKVFRRGIKCDLPDKI